MPYQMKTGIGTKHGKLTVIDRPFDRAMRIVRCDCGRELTVRAADLLNRNATACPACNGSPLCPFNDGVECWKSSDVKCKTCGWNPLVEHRRKRKRKGGS